MNGSITSKTAENMFFDAGVLFANYGETDERPLGATTGEQTLTIERTWRTPEVNGVKGKVKGLSRIVKENVSLSVNLLETTVENLELVLGGVTTTTTDADGKVGTTHTEIRSTGVIAEADYLKNIALVTTDVATGQPVVIVIENALNDGESLEIVFADESEAGIPVTFSGHYDSVNPDKVPYAIRKPVVAP